MNYVLNPDKSMTEISSMLVDISLFGYYQMFTFANIGPVLDNTVSFKNLINTRRVVTSESVQSVSTFTRKDKCNGVF
jgi:uncharacterized protein (UPF0303 family)